MVAEFWCLGGGCGLLFNWKMGFLVCREEYFFYFLFGLVSVMHVDDGF
jgi:hypothetical protein